MFSFHFSAACLGFFCFALFFSYLQTALNTSYSRKTPSSLLEELSLQREERWSELCVKKTWAPWVLWHVTNFYTRARTIKHLKFLLMVKCFWLLANLLSRHHWNSSNKLKMYWIIRTNLIATCYRKIRTFWLLRIPFSWFCFSKPL